MTVRTRFAPSPTGRLHLGNARVAVFNWLFARHHGGSFVLRLEDTDPERNVEGAEEEILGDLRWLGLEWDEGPDVGGSLGPYRQSERAHRHGEAAAQLLAAGAAYRCYCTEAAQDESREDGAAPARRYSGRCRSLEPADIARMEVEGRPSVIRFRTPDVQRLYVKDEVIGEITFPGNDIDDFVIVRSDGRATYNFAVVVDDRDMAITHVIRGAGHLNNTPKQVLLFRALGAPTPIFAHLPQILAADGGKLSKRAGARALADYRADGYPPQALLNYLSLLGWSDPGGREILSVRELVEAISLDRVGAGDAQLDAHKLRWVAQQHIAGESLEELVDHVRPFVDTAVYPEALVRLPQAVDAIRTRLATYGDVNEHLGLLYPPEDDTWRNLRAQVAGDADARRLLRTIAGALRDREEWDSQAAAALIRSVGKELGLKGPALFQPVRKALCGVEQGPDLGKVLAAIGRDEAVRRIRAVTDASCI